MENIKYTVRFPEGSIVVCAKNQSEAEILAKAEAIKKGWNYKNFNIVKPKLTHIDIYIDWSNFTPEEDIQFRMLLSKGRYTRDDYENK